MIELFAYGQKPLTTNAPTGEQIVLDISNPGAISLTYEVGKGEEALGRYSPFSQTFRLPFTNGNTEFFGHYYDVNIQPTAVSATDVFRFDVHRKCYAEIHVDGIPIIQGSLQLKNVHLKEEEFEVVVFGLEANLFQDISEKKLIDLFVSEAGVQNTDYDVNMTDANIISSFNLANDVTEGTVDAGTIVFPIIDYGHTQPYNFLQYQNDGAGGLGGIALADSLQPYMLKPSISVSHLFNKVLEEAGYNLLDSAFLLSDAWTKLYMTLASDRESVATRGVLGSQIANTDAPAIMTFSAPGGSTFVPVVVPFNDVTGAGTNNNPPTLYDEGTTWNTTTYSFVAPQSGHYFGEFHASFDSSSILQTNGAQASIGVFGGALANGGIYQWSGMNALYGGSGISTVIESIVCVFDGYLEAGEEMQCQVIVNPGGGASGAVKLRSEGTYCTIQASQLVNGFADIPHNMPDILQTDFVRDLVQRFNLCIVSDSDNPMSLIVQPWEDYINAGESKDWTDRLDLSKPRKITPTDSLRKKSIELKDAEDSTNLNAKFEKQNLHVLGRYKQEISGDFVSGTFTNNAIFAPFQVQKIPTVDDSWASDAEDFLIAREYGIDTAGPISDAKPKLFYHNGLKTLNNTSSFFVGSQESTSYPLCLPFYNNGSPMAIDSPMLLWDFEVGASFNNPTFGSTPSNQGYFARYWQQFLLSIYSDEARLFECSMLLSASDIYGFKFNDEIRIENTLYRVLKISNYQPLEDVPCRVQLLKKVELVASLTLPDPLQDCELNLTGYLANGTAIFTDPTDGTTSTGTEVCCNENHLYWDGSDCLWNTGAGGGGGTTNPGGNPNAPNSDGKNYLTGVGGFNTVKTLQAININPIQGEHSTSGINKNTNVFSTNKNFVFYATTYGAAGALATPDGDPLQNSSFSLPPNMMCRFVIRSLSVQKDSKGTTGSFGSTSFKVWTFVAKNINGTITTSGNEQTDFAQDDADAGTRTILVSGAKGGADFNPTDTLGVAITCTGSADRVITWHIDCSATFMELSSATGEADLILQENLGFILTENNNYLEQD
tara:strand:+ start:583 stop:3750 length:3168 start_codon:yes stop_codon:yes gene_type:complete